MRISDWSSDVCSSDLFSSGHPGPSSTAANPLGLRTSNDGGRTWTDSSLAGQVDFHSLVTDGTTLVGFDGARGVTVSKDRSEERSVGKEWVSTCRYRWAQTH